MPPDWEPPYPSFMSEFNASQKGVSMVVAGCQSDVIRREELHSIAAGLALLMRKAGAANHVDLSECAMDSAGCRQFVATGYWMDPDAVDSFFASEEFKTFWASHTAAGLEYGVFREVFNVPNSRFETLHSGPEHLVGAAHLRETISDPILEHAYWGSMRDRIPDAALDRFETSASVEVIEKGPNRIVVRPNRNMAIIRSGQDLKAATGTEHEEYYAEVEPVLQKGMAFLRDDGEEVDCFDCRYMSFVDEAGKTQPHTYGLAYFQSLESLENWAEHHPTHLAIFNAFLEFAPRYGPEMKSRYWHEVSVLPAENQFAEYINCKAGTGLLAGLEN
jgi:aldoxime dehydratase